MQLLPDTMLRLCSFDALIASLSSICAATMEHPFSAVGLHLDCCHLFSAALPAADVLSIQQFCVDLEYLRHENVHTAYVSAAPARRVFEHTACGC